MVGAGVGNGEKMLPPPGVAPAILNPGETWKKAYRKTSFIVLMILGHLYAMVNIGPNVLSTRLDISINHGESCSCNSIL
jgi:hypothetical protein